MPQWPYCLSSLGSITINDRQADGEIRLGLSNFTRGTFSFPLSLLNAVDRRTVLVWAVLFLWHFVIRSTRRARRRPRRPVSSLVRSAGTRKTIRRSDRNRNRNRTNGLFHGLLVVGFSNQTSGIVFQRARSHLLEHIMLQSSAAESCDIYPLNFH